jgi:hypothetical protein
LVFLAAMASSIASAPPIGRPMIAENAIQFLPILADKLE